MKASLLKSVAPVLVGLFLLLIATPTFGAPVSIPDPNLRTKVEQALGKSPGDPIDSTEMETLTLLSASGVSITDLTGLETALNLERLFIHSNNISDLSPISGLTSLTRIDADFNSISDLSPIAGLINMETLILSTNPISNVDALAGMTSLVSLTISNCQIDDVSGLADMTLLQNLLAINNQITDISPLTNLTSLQQLNLNSNFVSDVVALANLANLTILRLADNRISDIAALSGLPSLDIVDLSNNYLDLSPGSDDRAVIDGFPGTASVTESPQKTMGDYASWVSFWNIPFDQDAKTDTNGPLQFVNLIAFSMGLDPFSSVDNQIPSVVRTPGTDTYSFFYLRDVKALGVNRQINVSTDLTNWTPTIPDQVNVLTDDGNGIQYVEAVFEIPGPKQFFQFEVLDF